LCGFYAAASPAPALNNSGAPQDSARTIWDGAYTDAQAERGKVQYVQNCASCHSESLQGGDEAPGLVGEGFLASWIDLPVGDLFERTRISMPQDRPGQLSRSQYADVLAYLFRANKFPAGGTELPTDLAALKQIFIAAKRQ
jgi:quinoprotein glucose dehydrogenase